MTNFKITIQYDGRDFRGWQRQDGERTVQGVLETALSSLCDHKVTLHGSGRTDAGVHARAQCASFKTESPRTARQIIRGGKCLLPPDVAIIRAEEVSADFHARFSAVGKIYEYDFCTADTHRPLLNKRVWRLGPDINWAEVRRALPHFVGEHDFAAFQSVGSEVKSSVRTITRAELVDAGPDIIRLRLTGNGFLRHMVRAIAGLLAEIGKGRRRADEVPQILAAKQRALSGPTAPPDGLYLAEVIYEKTNLILGLL